MLVETVRVQPATVFRLERGQALLAIARGGKPYVAWEESVRKWLLLPGLAVLLAWLLAFGWHAWKSMGA